MADKIEIVKGPPVTFALGDVGKIRPLYGPPNEANTRRVVGWIDTAAVPELEAMLEYADAHMTDEDRP